MNPLYLETFRRRRRLFIGIVVVAVVCAMWMNLGAPKMYRSGITLWADAPGADSLPAGALTPAAREQITLNQLVALLPFRERVARNSPWPAYLKGHSVHGWGPGALVALLRGGGGGSLDAMVDSAVDPKRVGSAVPSGPNLLQITYDAPSPALARGTLQSLVDEYLRERLLLPAKLLAAYARQLQRASATAVAARDKLARYRGAHPKNGNPRTLDKLEAAVRTAGYQVAAARQALQTTQSGTAAAPLPTVSVQDGPSLPTLATTGHKKQVKALLAGLFAGLLVSGLGVVAMTKGPPLVRRSDASDPDVDFAAMSDAELASLIRGVDEEWANASDSPPNDLLERRKSSA